ncbi:MAG: SpoIIE family protein phosphatase [Bdellovibrionales bacterium]|nr:SpoIIE family protein phosphatase [Bdellovibrionales bacterium]
MAFQPGETLFLYTDGITEARNSKKEFFGEHRLKELLSKNTSDSIEEIGEKVLKSVWDFIGEEEQSDDIAYLLCQYNS